MHLEGPSQQLNRRSASQTLVAETSAPKSNTIHRPWLLGRMVYWWSLSVAALLVAVFGTTILFVSRLADRREWVYPWALWGTRAWLRLSGMKVRVRGLKLLDPKQTYLFVSNHHSYLDTVTLFRYTGRRIGMIAKKELLKVPILGRGMGYVNVMAIDRSNHERALRTMRAAVERIRSGVSFGVFAEGTRAGPGQMLPFKKGGFRMAIEAGVPIAPVAIKNTDVLMGKGTGVAWPGTIEVVFLPPVDTSRVSGEKELKRLVEEVQTAIATELGFEE